MITVLPSKPMSLEQAGVASFDYSVSPNSGISMVTSFGVVFRNIPMYFKDVSSWVFKVVVTDEEENQLYVSSFDNEGYLSVLAPMTKSSLLFFTIQAIFQNSMQF